MKHRNLIFDGIDFINELGLYFDKDGFTETPPALKYNLLQVPYGNDIDITEIVDGTLWYSHRKHTIRLNTVLDGDEELIKAFSRVMSRVHGKYGTYSLSFDPGCTYEGRLQVKTLEHTLRFAGYITIEITALPWKDMGTHYVEMRSQGGFSYEVESGRMPSVPVFELKYPTTVVVNGESAELHAGIDSSSLLVLHEGMNEISLISIEGMEIKTVGEVSSEYKKLGDMEGKKIYQLACIPDSSGEYDAIMTYEWKDL